MIKKNVVVQVVLNLVPMVGIEKCGWEKRNRHAVFDGVSSCGKRQHEMLDEIVVLVGLISKLCLGW